MSNFDELKRFEKDLKANEELRKALNDACKRIKDAGQAQSDGEIMVSAAKELGYDVSIAALEQARAETEALDPVALQAVAGGVHNVGKDKCPENPNFMCDVNYHSEWEDEEGHDAWCMTGWHCAAATLHNDTEDKHAYCWQDYKCWALQKDTIFD